MFRQTVGTECTGLFVQNMGVKWLPCVECGYVVPDCGDITWCAGCDQFLCCVCYAVCQRGQRTFICNYCWSDRPTIEDQLKMLRYVAEEHKLDLSQIREDMRERNLLKRKRDLEDANVEEPETERIKIVRREATVPPVHTCPPRRADKLDDVYWEDDSDYDEYES